MLVGKSTAAAGNIEPKMFARKPFPISSGDVIGAAAAALGSPAKSGVDSEGAGSGCRSASHASFLPLPLPFLPLPPPCGVGPPLPPHSPPPLPPLLHTEDICPCMPQMLHACKRVGSSLQKFVPGAHLVHLPVLNRLQISRVGGGAPPIARGGCCPPFCAFLS